MTSLKNIAAVTQSSTSTSNGERTTGKPSKFVEYTKFSEDATSVWYYFLKENSGQRAKCKNQECKKIIKTSGGSTSGLHKHLNSKHNVDIRKRKSSPGDQECGLQGEMKEKRPKKCLKISDFFEKSERNMAFVLARMAALDGIPFSLFITSIDLRESLKTRFNDLPSSAATVTKMVMDYSRKVRAEQKMEIADLKSKGFKFSLTFDEWTSNRNRRYMNLILNGGDKFWDLGLIRIVGSSTSEVCLKLVENKLQMYDLTLKADVISIITDGTSVMTKIGKLSPIHQQLCFVHAIQLAVTDVLYKKQVSDSVLNENISSLQHEDIEDGDFEDEENDTFGFSCEFEQDETPLSHEHVRPLVEKVRRIVKMFKRSPTKNEVLQKHVHDDYGKESTLLLDSKTRWNSLLSMLERFNTLKNSICKSLIDLKISTSVEQWEFDRIADLVKALQPLKVTVEALCRRDANLLTADAALSFALGKLDEQNTPLALELAEKLRFRIEQRRTEFSGVFQYLHNGSFSDEDEDELFAIPPRNRVCSIIKETIERLIPQPIVVPQIDASPNENQSNDKEDSTQQHKGKHALQVEMDNAIMQALQSSHIDRPQPMKTMNATIKKEMHLFEGGGSRGYHLQLVYDFLKNIRPTSVESERAFSSSGYLCNKIRCNMSDNTLNELCFLRSYFRNNPENLVLKNNTV